MIPVDQSPTSGRLLKRISKVTWFEHNKCFAIFSLVFGLVGVALVKYSEAKLRIDINYDRAH